MIGDEDDSGAAVADEVPKDGVNLSDPKQVKSRNKKLSAREELRKRFITRLLSDRDGREWMWDLLTFTKMYQTSFIAGDPHATSFNEGQRNVGLYLASQVPPGAMKLMMEEAPNYEG